MKKTLLFLVMVLFIATSYAGYVEIGLGTDQQDNVPCKALFNNSWSHGVIESSLIGEAKDFTELQFDVYNQADFTMLNQKLYLKLSNESEVTVSYPDPEQNGYTLVWEGDVHFFTGWNGFEFSETFSYDGTSNIEFVWEDRTGSYTWGGPQFYSTNTDSNTVAYNGC